MDLTSLSTSLATVSATSWRIVGERSEFVHSSYSQLHRNPETGANRDPDAVEKVARAMSPKSLAVYTLHEFGNMIVDFDKVLALTCARMGSLADSCQSELHANNFLAGSVLLRALLEHAAVLVDTHLQVTAKLAGDRLDLVNYLKSVEQVLATAGYGTRLNWQYLRNIVDLKGISKGDTAYVPDENGLKLTAQVLSSIDRVERVRPGLRISYELLSEFSHPNIGSSFLVSEGIETFLDPDGLTWVRRRVTRQSSLRGELQCFHPAFDLALTFVSEFLATIPSAITSYRSNRVPLLDAVQKAIRTLGAKGLKLFDPYVLCPCQSGTKVKFCCLPAVRHEP
jgi:hypothetical protein